MQNSWEGHVDGAGEDEADFRTFPVKGRGTIHLTMAKVEGGEDVELWLLDHERAGLDLLRVGAQSWFPKLRRLVLGPHAAGKE